MHNVELQNLKILIRHNQAESTNEKNVIIGESRFEPPKQNKGIVEKKFRETSSENSMLGG